MDENFKLSDISNIETLKENLGQVLTEIENGGAYQVVVKNNKPAVIFVNAQDFHGAQERLTELGEFARPFTDVIRESFGASDILNVAILQQKWAEVVNEVYIQNNLKVILDNDQPAIVLISFAEYQTLTQRLNALELEQTLKEMKEEYTRGELHNWEDLVAELGLEFEIPEKPEGYDAMIPEEYR